MKKKFFILTVLFVTSLALFTSCDTSDTTIDYTSVSINPAEVSMEVGETTTLIVSITVDDEVRYDLIPEFTSLDSTIAVVDAQGKVTALKLGTTKITATYDDVESECRVNVEEKDTTE